MIPRTLAEQQYIEVIGGKIESLKRHLIDQRMPEQDASTLDWYRFLLAMKEISGNTSNAMSFVASLMAKEYLSARLPMQTFDVAAKAQGAPGLDIDERTADGRRVIGEIKTTIPYMANDLGAQQKVTFRKDFDKLRNTEADFKFFFVTDDTVFRLMGGEVRSRTCGRYGCASSYGSRENGRWALNETSSGKQTIS